VILTAESTTKDYVLRFLEQVFVGRQDDISARLTERLEIRELDEDGNLVWEKQIL
jgi:hypothetical protein